MECELVFAGARSGSGPATWGQSTLWDAVRHLGEDAARYNVSGVAALPEPVSRRWVVDVLRELVCAHDSLRTTLCPADSGALEQVVHAFGVVPLVVRRCAPDEAVDTAYALYEDFQARPFDDGWPLRLGLVESAEGVHRVLFTVPHTACDGWGMRTLVADFLAGGPSAVKRLQPLEEAAFQGSTRGRRMDAAARRFWRDTLVAGPESQFPERHGTSPAPTFPNAVLNSPALAYALDRVSAAYGVPPSAALLAAVAVSVGRLTGVPETVLRVVVHNRFLPGLSRAVSTVAQEGLFRLTGTCDPFPTVLRRAFGASLAAHRYAYYDRRALDRDIAGLDRVCDHSCVVNDSRALASDPAQPEPASRTLSELSWPVEFAPRHNLTFALDAKDRNSGLELAMTADSAVLPRADMERLLLGIEDVLVRHTKGDPVCDSMPRSAG